MIEIGGQIDIGGQIFIGDIFLDVTYFVTQDDNFLVSQTGDNFIEEQ